MAIDLIGTGFNFKPSSINMLLMGYQPSGQPHKPLCVAARVELSAGNLIEGVKPRRDDSHRCGIAQPG
ncbi:Uncharacterised protein [Yersinia frederiksenii]|nr:Uncharacterised protein [Yersinia frederiksenii]